MEIERKPFECSVGERELTLHLGEVAVALFRTKQEVDYIAAHVKEDGEEYTLKIYNNQELAHYMAGYHIINQEGIIHRPVVRNGEFTFRERYGWNPAVVEREEPSESEEQGWVELNTDDLDGPLEL